MGCGPHVIEDERTERSVVPGGPIDAVLVQREYRIFLLVWLGLLALPGRPPANCLPRMVA